MDKIRVIGGQPLKGTIRISGAKNAALPLIAAGLLTAEPLLLTNLPYLADVISLQRLMQEIGADIIINSHHDTGHTLTVHAKHIVSTTAPYDLVRKMRASILVLGPLIARQRHARISLPGGCAIGLRPIDLHLKGLEALGAVITLEDGYVVAEAKNGLQGNDFHFPIVTVTGTENLLMAATLAKGVTRLYNVAVEPEITDLCHCLVKMGAKIQGIGTDTLTIHGVASLNGATHDIISDRIEAGTYAMAAGITGGELDLIGTDLQLLPMVTAVLSHVGLSFERLPHGFKVKGPRNGILQPHNMATAPYPNFPTDLQAQFMALMTKSQGVSTIHENIWENRMMHVPELNRMGACIHVNGNQATITGVAQLKGAQVMATDLRASVSLILAALAAEGETIISRVYHLDRGYEKIENKLRPCGAFIERIQEPANNDELSPLEVASP